MWLQCLMPMGHRFEVQLTLRHIDKHGAELRPLDAPSAVVVNFILRATIVASGAEVRDA
jgi:hypothetical protein